MSEVSLKQSGVRWLWLALLVFVADIGIKLFVMDNMGGCYDGWRVPNPIRDVKTG